MAQQPETQEEEEVSEADIPYIWPEEMDFIQPEEPDLSFTGALQYTRTKLYSYLQIQTPSTVCRTPGQAAGLVEKLCAENERIKASVPDKGPHSGSTSVALAEYAQRFDDAYFENNLLLFFNYSADEAYSLSYSGLRREPGKITLSADCMLDFGEQETGTTSQHLFFLEITGALTDNGELNASVAVRDTIAADDEITVALKPPCRNPDRIPRSGRKIDLEANIISSMHLRYALWDARAIDLNPPVMLSNEKEWYDWAHQIQHAPYNAGDDTIEHDELDLLWNRCLSGYSLDFDNYSVAAMIVSPENCFVLQSFGAVLQEDGTLSVGLNKAASYDEYYIVLQPIPKELADRVQRIETVYVK